LIDKLNVAANKRDLKSFRNFESEMEDYEPVEEEKDEDSAEHIQTDREVEAAQLPQAPAFGEIDYYRHLEGEN
jgi:hypothetical protein